MSLLMALVTLFLLATESHGIRWDFETDGDTQGWVATSSQYGLARLPSEVEAGVWRVLPPPYDPDDPPGLALISPLIGHDSELFDQVRLRFRVVHDRPIPGGVTLWWRNEHNRMDPGGPFSAIGYGAVIGMGPGHCANDSSAHGENRGQDSAGGSAGRADLAAGGQGELMENAWDCMHGRDLLSPNVTRAASLPTEADHAPCTHLAVHRARGGECIRHHLGLLRERHSGVDSPAR